MTTIALILAATGLIALWLHQHITDTEAGDIDAQEADRRIKRELNDIVTNRPHYVVRNADDMVVTWEDADDE